MNLRRKSRKKRFQGTARHSQQGQLFLRIGKYMDDLERTGRRLTDKPFVLNRIECHAIATLSITLTLQHYDTNQQVIKLDHYSFNSLTNRVFHIRFIKRRNISFIEDKVVDNVRMPLEGCVRTQMCHHLRSGLNQVQSVQKQVFATCHLLYLYIIYNIHCLNLIDEPYIERLKLFVNCDC